MLFEEWWSDEREEAFRANYKIDESLAIEILARDAFLAGMFQDASQQPNAADGGSACGDGEHGENYWRNEDGSVSYR